MAGLPFHLPTGSQQGKRAADFQQPSPQRRETTRSPTSPSVPGASRACTKTNRSARSPSSRKRTSDNARPPRSTIGCVFYTRRRKVTGRAWRDSLRRTSRHTVWWWQRHRLQPAVDPGETRRGRRACLLAAPALPAQRVGSEGLDRQEPPDGRCARRRHDPWTHGAAGGGQALHLHGIQ